MGASGVERVRSNLTLVKVCTVSCKILMAENVFGWISVIETVHESIYPIEL